MKKLDNARELEMISDVVLVSAVAFFNFFESPEKPPTRSVLNRGVAFVCRLLLPYHVGSAHKELATLLAK